jgi:DNA ligase-associated metallophosphoesterase
LKNPPSSDSARENFSVETQVGGEVVVLDPRRALWWGRGRSLFVADTHFGKDATARAQSIAIPHGVTASDLARLGEVIAQYQPETLWILGDVFDSAASGEAETLALVRNWCISQPCDVAMVPGNHDRRAVMLAQRCEISAHPDHSRLGPWRLTHEPGTGVGMHGLCGHLHPGVRLSGFGRERLRLPCFVLGEEESILPAFSEFTGLAIQSRMPGRRFFAITDCKVIALDSDQ